MQRRLTAPDVYNRIVHAKMYIDKHFQGPLNLDQLAGQAYLSRFHFHRLFTRVYRITPHRYLTQKRIAKACTLLASDLLSVTEVCNAVGFESVSSFSVLFKKQLGLSPADFREEACRKQKRALEHPATLIPACFLNQWQLDNLKSNFREASMPAIA